MSGWITFKKVGSASTPQDDDAEICTVVETGEQGLTLPYPIQLIDVVLTKSPAQDHQFSFWVNGKKVSSNLYAAQLDPANDTRFAIAPLGIIIPAGSRLQVRGAQKSGAAAEETMLTVIYKKVG